MKYKIKDTVDATNKPITVWHTDCVGQESKVCSLYLEGIKFLVDRGWAPAPLDMANNKNKAIWVENPEGEVMGVVMYEYMLAKRQGWIQMIVTAEKFRGRRGIYGILQRALEGEVIRLGGTSIASMTHKDNRARIKSGEREGMTPQFLRLYKDLTPNADNIKKQLSKDYNQNWPNLNKERWIER